MEKPSAPTPNFVSNTKDIKFTNEYQININKINYLIKIGAVMESKELVIFTKEENNIEYYYQNCFPLENLQNKNKFFKLFDKIEEIVDALKDIISKETLNIIKEEGNEELSIILKVKILGKKEEEINLTLRKYNEKTDIIISNLKAKIFDLESEVDKLKKEINSKNVQKYTPTLENGW